MNASFRLFDKKNNLLTFIYGPGTHLRLTKYIKDNKKQIAKILQYSGYDGDDIDDVTSDYL